MVDLPTKGIVHQLESQSKRIPRHMIWVRIHIFTYLRIYIFTNQNQDFFQKLRLIKKSTESNLH